ncbi:hypothetical protein AYW79_04240 [Ferroacidibacillus organovorans]|uniref:7-cyano-7-deazaguanine synthase n=1 Tax=Ferroacidibacillus organovorans TaxID=1765683 RepID=A0A853KC32_9BACL|nr:hypothetical protein AYJ22_03385 [Ferroacidibacillus organovorans]OAG94655.1 hypothetical protein AYW79_04240 [Ferroacidibacillus organovorans]
MPENNLFAADLSNDHNDLEIVLYGRRSELTQASVGAAIQHIVQRNRLNPAPRAWDLLSIVLSVITADMHVLRSESPDGWTREIELCVSVSDPEFWMSQQKLLEEQLQFLTTDVWKLSFVKCSLPLLPASQIFKPDQDCIVLLSGGLDSLIGAIDLVALDKHPYAVSQVAQGDTNQQRLFASRIGGGLAHLQLNHNAKCRGPHERSQRPRSLAFLAYGVLLATALKRYEEDANVNLYICENGFISINPPLTVSRLGSLSTRTTHPYFLQLFQELLSNAELRVTIANPYQFITKGEMLLGCKDQSLLHQHAHESTSCGRYARNGYKHCGRCVPCLIRRAAFHKWDIDDHTDYVYEDLSIPDRNHAEYDDVRAAAMAVQSVQSVGLENWAGPALSSAILHQADPYKSMVQRGLDELAAFLKTVGVA